LPPRIVAALQSAWNERLRARATAIGVTPFEQAQRSWARSITSYGDLPAPYAGYFEPLRARGDPFPLVVIAPAYEGFLHRETERLICAATDEITVLERRGHRLNSHRYPIARISYVETSSALLDARFKIVGFERGAPVPSAIAVRFNAVTEFLFTPIVTRIRAAGASRPGAKVDPRVFEAWGRHHLKFMNYARRSLLGDEAVLHAILQREIRVSLLPAFGRSFDRTVSPMHAAILTDRELISIREMPHAGDQERYGGIWDYIPLERIEGLSITANGPGLVDLSVRLPGNARLTLRYEESARPEVEALTGKFAELRASKL
jgi:hypothetical protein